MKLCWSCLINLWNRFERQIYEALGKTSEMSVEQCILVTTEMHDPLISFIRDL